MRVVIHLLLAAAAAVLAVPALARELPVPADKGWKHAESGVTLRRELIGLPRTKLTDSTDAEWDVAAQFNDPALATSLTIYIFHPGLVSAPMWFDRSITALQVNPVLGQSTPLQPAAPFVPPNGTLAIALRQVFTTGKGPYRSTAIAMVPLGDWLVAVRLSSTTLDAAALDGELSRALAAVGWPATTAARSSAAVAAVPVAACATSLSYRKAKQKPPSVMQGLMAGVLTAAMADKARTTPAEAPKPFCRDGQANADWAVYRTVDQTDGYTLALGDAGRSVAVYRSFDAPNLPGGYAVTLADVDGSTASYPYFDKLPRPEQVLDVVLKGTPVSTTQAGGKNITINGGVSK